MIVGADWTLHPWRQNNVGGVTAGQARHNSSNVGGVTAGQVQHNSSFTNQINKSAFLYSGLNSVTNPEEYGGCTGLHNTSMAPNDCVGLCCWCKPCWLDCH